MIQESIKVLIVEDHQTDLELIRRQVLKAAPNAILTTTSKRQEFEDKLKWLPPDIILSDYRLVDFNGLDALLFVKEGYPEIPFIFITGTLKNEQEVANAILKGASGYILKEDLEPLPEKIKEIYQDSLQKRKSKKEKKERLQQARLKLEKAYELVNKSDLTEKTSISSLLKEVREGLDSL